VHSKTGRGYQVAWFWQENTHRDNRIWNGRRFTIERIMRLAFFNKEPFPLCMLPYDCHGGTAKYMNRSASNESGRRRSHCLRTPPYDHRRVIADAVCMRVFGAIGVAGCNPQLIRYPRRSLQTAENVAEQSLWTCWISGKTTYRSWGYLCGSGVGSVAVNCHLATDLGDKRSWRQFRSNRRWGDGFQRTRPSGGSS
jgi:hypothetical protein